MMRLNPEDEHVSIYGRTWTRSSSLSSSVCGPTLLKTWSGNYHHDIDVVMDMGTTEHVQQQQQAAHVQETIPYPRLPIRQINKILQQNSYNWMIDSIRMSNVQLLGTRQEFHDLASYLIINHSSTLKTMFLSDTKTSLLTQRTTSTSIQQHEQEQSQPHMTIIDEGLDILLRALSLHATNLHEISLQNMHLISNSSLGNLCTSKSLIKLQLLLSQSTLLLQQQQQQQQQQQSNNNSNNNSGGCITGSYIEPITQQLSTTITSALQELRIFGVLDYDACDCITQMLQKNTTLQKISIKMKLQSQLQQDQDQGHSSTSSSSSSSWPLLDALGTSSCNLSSLELYLSGTRSDVEVYANEFCTCLQYNQSLRHLNIILYGILYNNGSNNASPQQSPSRRRQQHQQGGVGGNAMRMMMSSMAMASLQQFDINQIWIEQITKLLKEGNNYFLEQILMNHGLVELSDTIKFYLKLNRVVKRRNLLLLHQSHYDHHSADVIQNSVVHGNTTVIRKTGTDNRGNQHGLCQNVQRYPSVVVPSTPGSNNTKEESDDDDDDVNGNGTIAVDTEIDLWITTLDRVKNDVSCVFYLLSCNPDLFCKYFFQQNHDHEKKCLYDDDVDSDDSDGNLPLKRKAMNM